MSRPPISLQLYTVRDSLQTDPLGTLEKIAALGYEGIEIGLDNTDEFVAKARQLNLAITGVHVGIDALKNNLEGVINGCQKLETSFVILSYVDESYRGSVENWQNLARILEDVGQKLHEAGITLCYHNHDFEFEQIDGKYGLDILFEAANPQYLQAELDTYWVQKGGANPVEYIRKYAGRVPVLHIKDMTPGGNFAEIGEGTLDWPAIFAAAEAQGVTTYIVEQDTCPGDPIDSIAISIKNLREMGKI